jgi:uncharacterized iron-regulated membrane protein
MALQTLVTRLRQFRLIHKWIGISLVTLLLITSITGLILGWKKNVAAIQPATLTGASKNISTWVSFSEVVASANHALDSSVHISGEIERLDVRIDKGIVKVIYINYWEVQIDGKSGKALSIKRRHSDWIEHIHDGSIISEGFKLFYTSYLGWGLLILSISGFWLWYGPKRVRKIKNSN